MDKGFSKMFRLTHFILSVALFFYYQISYAESIMNKCTDGKQITYTDKPCGKLGLTDAGPLKTTVTIIPSSPIPASPKPAVPQNKSHENDVPAADSDVYQCTTSNGLVSYSSNPCPKSSLLPQGYYAPIQQQTISRSMACEKVGVNPNANPGGNLSCP
jgi:hypothetical protein